MDSTLDQPQPGLDRVNRGFPAVPASWFHLCRSRELDRKPVGLELGGRSFVGYRTRSGRAVVLARRCAHLGADLAAGTVYGERLACPLHGWEYGANGVCEKIPASATIPGFARQTSYPVEECRGHVFFFNQPHARFPLPFFEGRHPETLTPAQPFEFVAEVPWYLVGANGFDVQHFRFAHDRVLVGEVQVSSPSPFARRISATYEVTGRSWRDRFTRCFSGARVTMTVTDWSGSLILVSAAFQHTTSYGLVSTRPIDARRTHVRVIIWVPRSASSLGRGLVDPLDVWIRRSFIWEFLRSDLPRTAGLRYQPEHLIAADRTLADYLDWLKTISEPSTKETK